MTLEEVTTLKEAIKRLKEVIKEVRSTIQPFLYDNEAKDYILKALEQEPKWIPIKTRPLTDKEKEEYADLGYSEDSINFMYDCHLPEDGEEVLITTRYDEVRTDTFYHDDGCYFETYCDEDDVKAWMPLPEPYKEESEEQVMKEIKCPYDLNQFLLGEPIFENPFPEEECEQRKFYGDCYHCFSTAIASRDHQLKHGMTNKIKEIVAEWKADTWTDNFSYECMCKIADLLSESEVKE